MNYNTLIDLEYNGEGRNPRVINKFGSLTVYESLKHNLYYVFLSDWFMFAFQYNGTMIFYSEKELIDYLRR